MDCDQVFAVLTRAPFPTESDLDLQVEGHLSRCPSCGRLAEALRPAPDLFHEALTAEEGRSLPGYRSGVVSRTTASANIAPQGYVSTRVRNGAGTATRQRVSLGRRSLPYIPPQETLERGDAPWRGAMVVASFLIALATGMATLGWVLS
ncbi:MAG: hypothetical protein ACRCT8_13380 [Lacipirellulaceae bacterium]